MIEIAEASVYAKSMAKELKGHTIIDVKALRAPHSFCWMSAEPSVYEQELLGLVITDVTSSAHYLRIHFSNGKELSVGEDVNLEYKPEHLISKKNQLVLVFDHHLALEFKIKLYGFILYGHAEEMASKMLYYKKAIDAIHPLDDRFTYNHFMSITGLDGTKGSVKSALATEQHIPGLGNGTLQDILFHAKLSPKRKISTLSDEDKHRLYDSVRFKIDEMITFDGRDLQTNMFGEKGGYDVLMKNERITCPICHTNLQKEAFLGGKVIYCPVCQK